MKNHLVFLLCIALTGICNAQISLNAITCDRLEASFPQVVQGKSIINLELEIQPNIWKKVSSFQSYSNSVVFDILYNGNYRASLFRDHSSDINVITKWNIVANTSNSILVNCATPRESQFDQPSNVVSLHPNPVSQSLKLNLLDEIKDYKVSILDIKGKLISTIKNAPSIDVSAYSSGLYYLKFESANHSKTLKFIVSH